MGPHAANANLSRVKLIILRQSALPGRSVGIAMMMTMLIKMIIMNATLNATLIMMSCLLKNFVLKTMAAVST